MCFVDISSANCLRAFLCIVFRRGFPLEWQPWIPIWCRVRRIVWALTGWHPPPLSSLQQCWQHSYADLWKKEFGYDAQHVHSASLEDLPEACSEWTPTLLKDWMILATVLQLTFRVLAIFLWPWPSSCSTTIHLLRSSESSLPCGAILELSVTSMRECESCTTNLNTPAPYAHVGLVTQGPSNTNETHDIFKEKWQAVLNLDI